MIVPALAVSAAAATIPFAPPPRIDYALTRIEGASRIDWTETVHSFATIAAIA